MSTLRRALGTPPAREGGDSTVRTEEVSEARKPSRNCWIDGKRSAATFAMACLTAVSTDGGTVCRTTRRLGTGSMEWRAMTA